MPDYRRSKIEGGTYFFTVVTYHRQSILSTDLSRSLLHNAWNNVVSRYPFVTVAICLLPDHIHCLWRMPEGDMNYALRWGEIKRLFSRNYLRYAGGSGQRNESREKRREAVIWQRRYWEHFIRDNRDLEKHMDYIHYNPVKHGLVNRVRDWPWSSFHRYVNMGYYPIDWGDEVMISDEKMHFGE